MPGIISDAKGQGSKKNSLKFNSSGKDKQNEYIIIYENCRVSISQPNFYKTKRYLHFSTVTIQIHWLHTPENNSKKRDLLKALAQKNLVSQVLKESNHSSPRDQEYLSLPN